MKTPDTPGTKHQTPYNKHQTTKYQAPNTKYQTLDTPGTKHQTLNTRHKTPPAPKYQNTKIQNLSAGLSLARLRLAAARW